MALLSEKGYGSTPNSNRSVEYKLTNMSPARAKQAVLVATSVLAFSALAALMAPQPAHAVACVNGVYRAGCAGPNGAAVVRKPPARGNVTCANGVYRAGCVGPNGAAVVRK
jgi:hypothetical protein